MVLTARETTESSCGRGEDWSGANHRQGRRPPWVTRRPKATKQPHPVRSADVVDVGVDDAALGILWRRGEAPVRAVDDGRSNGEAAAAALSGDEEIDE